MVGDVLVVGDVVVASSLAVNDVLVEHTLVVGDVVAIRILHDVLVVRGAFFIICDLFVILF